jgi:hypothetical protein
LTIFFTSFTSIPRRGQAILSEGGDKFCVWEDWEQNLIHKNWRNKPGNQVGEEAGVREGPKSCPETHGKCQEGAKPKSWGLKSGFCNAENSSSVLESSACKADKRWSEMGMCQLWAHTCRDHCSGTHKRGKGNSSSSPKVQDWSLQNWHPGTKWSFVLVTFESESKLFGRRLC